MFRSEVWKNRSGELYVTFLFSCSIPPIRSLIKIPRLHNFQCQKMHVCKSTFFDICAYLETMDKLNSMLAKYRETVAIDSAKARGYIQKLNYRENFYLLQCIAQTYLDESRFEEGSDKMRKTIDLRKWRMAEKYIIAAYTLNSNNAEVLYTMGEVRKVNHREDLAIYCFEKIIKLGVNKIARQEYSRGNAFAKELINDAKFELYRLHFYDNPKLSARYLRMYKSALAKGVDTIFKPLRKFLVN